MSLRGKQVYGDMNATNAVSFVGIMDDCFQISNIKVGCSKIK